MKSKSILNAVPIAIKGLAAMPDYYNQAPNSCYN